MAAIAGALTAGAMMIGASAASAATCTPVVTSKGTLTAAVIDTSLAGTVVDASGCDIGAYYDSVGNGASVSSGAEIFGATQYGVFVDGGKGNVSVDVTNSSIHNIGDVPFGGVQHGIGIYYYGYNTLGTVSGTVSSNSVFAYQKGGITVNGGNASANVTGNTVTGLGQVPFIAQNGIQFGFGATGVASGNQISGNYYTGCSNQDAAKTGCVPYVSAGLLLYDINPSQVSRFNNKYRDDQRNELVVTDAQLNAHS
ncbi:MAG TPA: hypothetical protein VMU90_11575 [Solirubrobacteraceae bacterium]|nr:hypothetical protein [Solirubrobacteraceae bacterium]HVC34212.1 hypothetical protein [Chloroflexota bacterium]